MASSRHPGAAALRRGGGILGETEVQRQFIRCPSSVFCSELQDCFGVAHLIPSQRSELVGASVCSSVDLVVWMASWQLRQAKYGWYKAWSAGQISREEGMILPDMSLLLGPEGNKSRRSSRVPLGSQLSLFHLLRPLLPLGYHFVRRIFASDPTKTQLLFLQPAASLVRGGGGGGRHRRTVVLP